MADQYNRNLERAASGGDRQAAIRLRIENLRAGRETPDPAGLAAALGVPEAARLLVAIGVSTLGGLLTLTRDELVSRPKHLLDVWGPSYKDWWRSEPIVGQDVLIGVLHGLQASGLRLRRPDEAVRIALPQKTIAVDPSACFSDQEFYGALPRAVSRAVGPALRSLGIATWAAICARCRRDYASVPATAFLAMALPFELARRGLRLAPSPDGPPTGRQAAPQPQARTQQPRPQQAQAATQQQEVESAPYTELGDDVSGAEEEVAPMGHDDLGEPEDEDDASEYVTEEYVPTGGQELSPSIRENELVDDRTGGSAELRVDEEDPGQDEREVPDADVNK